MMPNDLYEELLGENMQLRNKRTGDIWEFDGISMAISDSTKEKLGARGCSGSCYARSLSELNECWEDVEPAEPLIKDEKIRKAVRAWAEANDFVRVFYEYDYSNDVAVFMVGESKMTIESDELLDDGGKNYTIAELCGEEEE